MRSNVTRTVLAAAALATSAGLACAQVAARIDGTGAGLNAGVGASSSLDPGTNGSVNNGMGLSGSAGVNGNANANSNITAPSANDPRVLGSGPRTPGNIVPDNLPGTIGGQSNATVGINGTGTLDGSVPSTDVGADRGLGSGVQR
jgi:hypothetical protein